MFRDYWQGKGCSILKIANICSTVHPKIESHYLATTFYDMFSQNATRHSVTTCEKE